MNQLIQLGTTVIKVPDFIVCLSQEDIDSITRESDKHEKIIGAGVHPDNTVMFILATGEIRTFNQDEHLIPSGPYIPQEDGYTVFLPNDNRRWPSHTRGFTVQSSWLIKRSKPALAGAELLVNDKSLGKFDFDSTETK